MWYPVHQQQQQHSCYGYTHHHPSHQQQQQQQTYLRTSYYCNTDELSTTCVEAINDENDSSNHCQTTYSGSAHATTANYYMTPSLNPYGDEMSSHQTTTTTRKTYWNPVIVAPNRNMNMLTPSMSAVSSSSLSHTSSCWDWLLYSPQYYSEFYTPSSTHTQQKKFDEEDDKENDHGWSFLTSLPTCLLSLLCLTPQLIQTSDDENDSDPEMNIVPSTDESSVLLNHVDATTLNNISPNLLLSSTNTTKPNVNRSSTPETDDGYQSANDASRSDYSQPSSVPYDHHSSKDDISVNEHSLPKPLMPRRISYAAAAKPITTIPSPTTKISSLSTAVSKPKQTINKILTGITTANDISSTNGQKLKFIAPRFERMHHAKQHSSSSITTTVNPSSTSTASNRTQTRSTNINNNNYHHQRNHMMNSTRRR